MSNDNQHHLHSRPLDGRFSLRRNGSARLTFKSKAHETTVELGPGYSARIAQKGKGWLREVTVSSATSNCAYVLSRLAVEGQGIEKRVVTEFSSKTVREDIYRVDGNGLTRTARWNYRNGVEINAAYGPGKRTLEVSRGGQVITTLLTTGRPVGRTFEAVTKRMDGSDGSVTIVGDKTVGPGKSSTVIGVVQPNGPFQYGTVSMRPNGNIVASQVVPLGDRMVEAGQTVTDLNDGSVVSDAVVTATNANGTTTVVSGHGEVTGEGTTNTIGVASTKAEGGFSTYTEASKDGITTQRSSYGNDGQGNESQTTVTYNPDGSFTIDTTSKDSDGNVTSNTETFGPDGNPQPSEGGGGEGGGGEGGGGEFPADDGTDPNPRPNTMGHGDGAFTQWLSGQDSFFGSNPKSPFSPRNPGDPADLIGIAMDQDEDSVRPNAPGGPSDNESVSGTLDLRPFLRKERDPENNPRALVAALATLAGISSGGALRAADKALGAL